MYHYVNDVLNILKVLKMLKDDSMVCWAFKFILAIFHSADDDTRHLLEVLVICLSCKIEFLYNTKDVII